MGRRSGVLRIYERGNVAVRIMRCENVVGRVGLEFLAGQSFLADMVLLMMVVSLYCVGADCLPSWLCRPVTIKYVSRNMFLA